MSAKQIAYEAEARQHVLKGIEKLSKAVKSTLGPRGRTVVLEKKFGSPTITKDGVAVAKEIELENPFENMGAQSAKSPARPATSPVMAPRPPRFWWKPFTAKDSRT